MKAYLFLLISSLSLSAFATGDEPDLGKEYKIKADMVCGDKGGAFHINTKKEQVWQAEIDSTEGYRLKVTKFERLRCPGCFNIDVELDMMGQTAYYALRTRTDGSAGGKIKNKMFIKLARDSEHEEVVDSWTWKCGSSRPL